MRHHRTIAVLAIASIGVMAGCGDDDTAADTTAATTAPTTVVAEPTTTHAGTHPGTAPTSEPATTAVVDDGVLTIVLSDYAFGGLPESVPAGTKLAVQNISQAELHEVVAFKGLGIEQRDVFGSILKIAVHDHVPARSD